ncbi:MAG TPA: ATP-grasp domain-containing protein, partial [Tahibacter sp.]|nr:ATP-grasp domain-containing protein [Tahibacter sp.]
EYRCFVLDRRLMTYSIYSRRGELQRDADFRSNAAEDDEMREFVETVLADTRVDLPRAAVVDVGVIAGRGWACVEQNAAWGAGIYGCDPRVVLDVIRQAVTAIDQRRG